MVLLRSYAFVRTATMESILSFSAPTSSSSYFASACGVSSHWTRSICFGNPILLIQFAVLCYAFPLCQLAHACSLSLSVNLNRLFVVLLLKYFSSVYCFVSMVRNSLLMSSWQKQRQRTAIQIRCTHKHTNSLLSMVETTSKHS